MLQGKRMMVALAAVSMVVPMMPMSVVAQEGDAFGDEWDFQVTPFLWAGGLYGDTTMGHSTGDINVDFGDLLDALNAAAMVDFRLQKGRWALQSNLVWAALEGSGDLRINEHIEVKPKMWLADLNAQYMLTEHWGVLAGIRYFDVEVTAKGSGLRTFDKKGEEEWIDPIIGAEFKSPLSERWSLSARGDFGGFVQGSDMDVSWQLWGAFDYRFGKKNALTLGYRHLDWRYENGSGENRFYMDTYMTGPFLGVKLHF